MNLKRLDDVFSSTNIDRLIIIQMSCCHGDEGNNDYNDGAALSLLFFIQNKMLIF